MIAYDCRLFVFILFSLCSSLSMLSFVIIDVLIIIKSSKQVS